MDSSDAMTIVVEFEIRHETATMPEWIAPFAVRANDARSHEPRTTAYEAAVSSSNPHRVLVFERYEGGQAALLEHMNRPAHKVLTEDPRNVQMTRRRPWMAMGHELADAGWRVSDEAVEGLEGQGMVIVVIALACPAREALVSSCRAHAEASLSTDPGLLLHSVSTVSLDYHNDVELSEGDLAVALVFGDRDAYTAHTHGDIWRQLQSDIERLRAQVLLERDYTTTGCGFVWKGATSSQPDPSS